MSKLRKFKYTFEFSTDRKLTYAEKMQISSDGLHALHGIVRDVVGDSAAHNMDFGWGPDGDPWEPKKKKPMDKLEPEDRKIVLAYAENNMRVAAVAQKLYMHRNTVEYHLNKVKTVTGLDPRKFTELLKLLDI